MSKNRKTFKAFVSLVAVLLVGAFMTFTGCANSGDDESANTAGIQMPTSVTVGLNVCTDCHAGQVTQWMLGQHGNNETIDEGAVSALFVTSLDNTGFPDYAMLDEETECVSCHDPLGDGYRLTAEWTGNVPRPVIGCESCHGGGSNHFGIGFIPFAAPSHEQCGQCHNSTFPEGHLPYHPLGANIVEDYEASLHMQSINSHTLVEGTTNQVRATCSRCHTDQGFKLYNYVVPGTSGHDAIVDALGDLPAVSNASPVECRTCHDGHMATADNLVLLPDSFDTMGNYQSSEFNTCTACHQLVNPDGTVMTDAYHDPSVNQYGSLEEILAPNHAAVPGDTRLNSGPDKVDVFFVRKGDDNACTACHNPHSADITINEQYAESAHGDRIGDPWTHYPWADSSGTSTDRKSCQRCHTTTGFKNWANNQAGYVPANNFPDNGLYWGPYLKATAGNTGQLETIYCWGCHTNFKGAIRNPGQVVPGYKTMAGAAVTLPDASSSNTCVGCHGGRESGGSIVASTADFSNVKFINSHYLAAGGVLFKAIGYEYPSLDYSNVPYYEHDQIGMGGEEPGEGGPCAGCHMSTPTSHSFLPVAVDEATDAVTAITSTVCASCHTPGTQYEMTVTKLEEESALFDDAMQALYIQLSLRGFWFGAGNPYFFTAEYVPGGTNTSVTNWLTGGVAATGKPNMGAAFNYNVLEHEPGAFVHNRMYAKRLIYDSIDWLDNDSMDDSVKATLTSLSDETDYKAGAIEYLLNSIDCTPNSDCRPGNSAD